MFHSSAMHIQQSEHRGHSAGRNKPDFPRTNWQQLRINLNQNINGDLRNILENKNALHDVGAVDEAIDVLTKSTVSALENSTPSIKIGSIGIRLSEDAEKVITTRNYFRRRWQRNRRANLIKYKKMVKIIHP